MSPRNMHQRLLKEYLGQILIKDEIVQDLAEINYKRAET